MRHTLLELLACPKCHGKLESCSLETDAQADIISGTLQCRSCQKSYPIENRIPRFVEREGYVSSFGYQWNKFKSEQIDSLNGTSLSGERFYAETNWSKEWLRGKWILDVGCGAGRFLDVASNAGCEVVGVDMSNATEAAQATLGERTNVHIVQASIYDLPFRSGAFDGCYCIGVIQHTPDPDRALRSLPRVLKKGGLIAVTIYERRRWTKMNAKYLVRPLTSRLNKKLLLGLVRGAMPILFPTTELLFRVPYLGRLFRHAIPVANYVNEPRLTRRQRYNWALLDTFDMLAPEYDQPQIEKDVVAALEDSGIDKPRRHSHVGLNVVGMKTDRHGR
jgi:2-polyprenyl-3-methyl-5-hydroxy-6-metoxy-1,4-benzoquinol methylase/uncharacterized protein YbaR (Trm112 family)